MKTALRRNQALLLPILTAVSIALCIPQVSMAAGRGGNVQPRPHAGNARAGNAPQLNNAQADSRTRNVRNTSVNNVNSNRNVNVNKNVNVNVENHGGGWDNDYHPIATAAAVTATVAVTSAVIGSIVHSVPPNCMPVNYGGMIYQQCGSTWYQPQGTQYIVVNPPY